MSRERGSGSREDENAPRSRRCGSTDDDQLERLRLLNVREDRCATLAHRCGVTERRGAGRSRRLGATDDCDKATEHGSIATQDRRAARSRRLSAVNEQYDASDRRLHRAFVRSTAMRRRFGPSMAAPHARHRRRRVFGPGRGIASRRAERSERASASSWTARVRRVILLAGWDHREGRRVND